MAGVATLVYVGFCAPKYKVVFHPSKLPYTGRYPNGKGADCKFACVTLGAHVGVALCRFKSCPPNQLPDSFRMM